MLKELELKKDALVNYLVNGTYSNGMIKELHEELEGYDEDDFITGLEIEGMELIVLTDREADERAADEIKNSLWAFCPEWLSNFCDIPADKIKKIQTALYEDANELIELWIKDMDDFIESSIMEESNGRGHFISYYDGEEVELIAENGKILYLYRLN